MLTIQTCLDDEQAGELRGERRNHPPRTGSSRRGPLSGLIPRNSLLIEVFLPYRNNGDHLPSHSTCRGHFMTVNHRGRYLSQGNDQVKMNFEIRGLDWGHFSAF